MTEDQLQIHIDKAVELVKDNPASMSAQTEAMIAQAIALQGIGNLLQEISVYMSTVNVNLQGIWEIMNSRRNS